MRYYTIDESEKNILIYEYKALVERLYEYKKRKMEQEKYKLLQAVFTLRSGCDCSFEETEFNITKSNNIIAGAFPYISYYDVSSSLEEQQELLEKFYRGEVVIGRIRDFRQPSIYDANDVALFPQEISVKKSEYQFHDNHVLYFTNDVIKVPESIMLLRDLEDGNIDSVAKNADKLDDQLECFDFSVEPIDCIKLDSLRTIYGGKRINSLYGSQTDEIIQHTVKTAKENQKILQLVKSDKK